MKGAIMAKYEVTILGAASMVRDIQVEANSPEEAEEKALNEVNGDLDFGRWIEKPYVFEVEEQETIPQPTSQKVLLIR